MVVRALRFNPHGDEGERKPAGQLHEVHGRVRRPDWALSPACSPVRPERLCLHVGPARAGLPQPRPCVPRLSRRSRHRPSRRDPSAILARKLTPIPSKLVRGPLRSTLCSTKLHTVSIDRVRGRSTSSTPRSPGRTRAFRAEERRRCRQRSAQRTRLHRLRSAPRLATRHRGGGCN
jgi:hypothetical protein